MMTGRHERVPAESKATSVQPRRHTHQQPAVLLQYEVVEPLLLMLPLARQHERIPATGQQLTFETRHRALDQSRVAGHLERSELLVSADARKLIEAGG